MNTLLLSITKYSYFEIIIALGLGILKHIHTPQI